MIQIPLQSIPNQSLSITLDGNFYDINFYANADNKDGTSGISSVDIVRDGTIVVTGMRAINGFPIIPAEYLENGNFIFVTANDEYPDWRQFGISQYLIFASESELEAIRGTGT